MRGMKFYIMNGAGNRFPIFDARKAAGFVMSADKAKEICTPDSDIMGPKGGDQLIIMRLPKTEAADIFMEIWNREGFQVDACGNATRCICLLYTSPSPRDQRGSRMPSSA